MKKILITGSEGYIGKVLVDKLIKVGYEVTGLDTCFYETFQPTQLHYQLIKQDIRDLNLPHLGNYEVIVHLAALSNDPTGEFLPDMTQKINYEATVNLAAKAKKQGVKRFLFASSCSIYGIADGWVDENSVTDPLTEYAKSKIAAEKELKKLADGKFCVGILRNSTVYGFSPAMRNDLVVNNLVATALATHQIRVMSDGTPWRPLIDVRDLSAIILEFIKARADLINGEVFNIGFNENNVQVKDILHKIRKILPDCEVIYTGEHGSDSRSYRVKFDKFHNAFPSIKQQWPLEKSIKNLIEKSRDTNIETAVRLPVLKKLLTQQRLDKNLYWTNSG